MNDHAANPAPTRREFHAAVALLAGAPLAALTADDKPPVDPVVAIGDALAAAAKARFGKHLTAEQLIDVERAVRGGVLRAESMKKMLLANGDEPGFVFSADV